MALPQDLANSTSRDLADRAPVLVIPLGSTEQHGPHLPLDTDTRIAAAVAAAAADRAQRATGGRSGAVDYLTAPAIPYGASGEHEAFPGTVSIGSEALEHLLVEYGRSATRWCDRLVFVNGHGGNLPALVAAVSRLRGEGRDAAWCPCVVAGGDAHAGHTETSVLLHLWPEAVRIGECRPGNTEPLVDLMPRMRSGGVMAVSEVGVLGDPTTASRTAGEQLFEEMVAGCTRRLLRWEPRADGMLT